MRAKTKGMSLISRGEDEYEGKYQIWSSGSYDEEMRNPMHGAMFARYEDEAKEKVTGSFLFQHQGTKRQ